MILLKRRPPNLKSLYSFLLTTLYCLCRVWHEKIGLNKAKHWPWLKTMVLSFGRYGYDDDLAIEDVGNQEFTNIDLKIGIRNVGLKNQQEKSFLKISTGEPTSPSSLQMRDQAYEICRKYLSGEWNNISPGDMVFKPVSGGLSNLLFYCSLPSTHTPVTGEPSQVLLRMYGQLLDKNDTKITDSVITMLLSERNLGPKLYGIFPGGRLEEYIPARAMRTSELKEPKYSAIIARKLAIVHDLNVPINKEPTFVPDLMNKWLKNIRQVPITDEMSPLEKELVSFDFEKESETLFQILSQCPSPVVFCHNDLQEGNILLPINEELIDELLNSSMSKIEDFENHIVFIDFEYCAYNYRGFDIGNHFCERMFDYSNPEWPHYYSNLDEYPNDDDKRAFIAEYLKQYKEIKSGGDEQVDTEDHLIMESDFYTLAVHLLWTLWSVISARTSKIPFGYMEYGKTRLDAYHRHKKYVLEKYCLTK